MNRLFLLLTLVAGVGTLPARAQRHIKNFNAVGVTYGASEQGRLVELSYGRYVTDHLLLRTAALSEWGNPASGYRVGQLSAHLAPQVLCLGESFYLHALAGVVGRYEWTEKNRTAEDASQTPQRVTFGPELGAEADLFLGNRISLTGSARRAHIFNDSRIDAWPGTYAVGLRLHIP